MIEDVFDYAHDFENRLTKVKLMTTSDSVRMEYDGVGQRTRKIGLTDTTRYTWDGLYPVVEWNNQGKLKQSFIYANGLLLGIVDSTLATSKRYFVLHDGLGSSVALTDSAANIKRSLIYSDFGERLVDTTASSVPSFNRLYAGYSWDSSPANFYWMKYRQTYDPGLGRFGQEDPSHLSFNCRKGIKGQNAPQVLNRLIYGLNKPTTLIDPTGLEACCNYWLGFGAGGGAYWGLYIGTVSYYCWDDKCSQRKAGTLNFSCSCTWSFGMGASASIGPMMQCNNSIEDLIPSYDSFEGGFKTFYVFSWDKYRDISDLSIGYGPGFFLGKCNCTYLHGATKDWGSK
jgi:RHS repeat-associated protein